MNDKEMLKQIRAAKFVENNGRVLRAINILRHKYIKLSDVFYALEKEMSESEYLDCINFLSEAGYINLRNISTNEPADLDKCEYTDLKAKLSHNGIRLLEGEIIDKSVRV